MAREQERRAIDIVAELEELPLSERERRLNELCGDDVSLMELVRKLQTRHQALAEDSFLARPAIADVSPSVLDHGPSEAPAPAADTPVSSAPLVQESDAASEDTQTEFPGSAESEDTLDDLGTPPPAGRSSHPGSMGSSAGPVPPRGHKDRFVRRHLLGRGGQGEVWLAFDPKLGRYVALKEIRQNLRDSEATISGFRNEARLTGELEHPNIVTVYEAEHLQDESASSAAESESAPFYVMRVFGNRNIMKAIAEFHARKRSASEYQLLTDLTTLQDRPSVENQQRLRATLETFPFDEQHPCDLRLREAVEGYLDDPQALDGRSLHEAIRELHATPWCGDSERTLRDLLRRFIHICNAVGYAHSRGLIHRDLKPQNVMLGGFGETLVVDWGLAKVVGRDELHADGTEGTVSAVRNATETILGSVKGTPKYMPPEQARGDVTSLGPKSDIYSLGAILYALLTGEPPVSGRTAAEVLEQVKAGRIPKPTERHPQTSKALEAVCLKALEKEPLDRYGTALDLAADVARWLDDEPVTAWPEPFTIRARRWIKRNQTLVSSTAAAMLMAMITLSILFIVVSGKNEELAGKNSELDSFNTQLTAANERLKQLNESEHAAKMLALEREEEAKVSEQRAVEQQHLAEAAEMRATQKALELQAETERLELALESGFTFLRGIESGRYRSLDDAYSDIVQNGLKLPDKERAAMRPLYEAVLQLEHALATKRGLSQEDSYVLDQGSLTEKALLAVRNPDVGKISGHLEKALRSLEESREITDQIGLAWLLTAQIRMEHLKHDRASVLSDWNRAVELLEHCSAAFSGRGFCYLQLDQTEKATQDLEQALKLDPRNEYAHLGIARVAYRNSDYDLAISHFTTLLQLEPRYDTSSRWKLHRGVEAGSAWELRGFQHQKAERFAEAFNDYVLAVQHTGPTERPRLWARILFLIITDRVGNGTVVEVFSELEHQLAVARSFEVARDALLAIARSRIEASDKADSLVRTIVEQVRANPDLTREMSDLFREALHTWVEQDSTPEFTKQRLRPLLEVLPAPDNTDAQVVAQ